MFSPLVAGGPIFNSRPRRRSAGMRRSMKGINGLLIEILMYEYRLCTIKRNDARYSRRCCQVKNSTEKINDHCNYYYLSFAYNKI